MTTDHNPLGAAETGAPVELLASAEDREIMGSPEAAKAALIEKARAWRETRQPSIDTAAGHKARDKAEHQIRFELANAALLWLWHEELGLAYVEGIRSLAQTGVRR